MKYAVVTGSTKGIGKAIAEKLISEGWFVFVNYAFDEECANKFLSEHENVKDRFELIKCELCNQESARNFISKVLKKTSVIDCLVLNVGATDRTSFENIDYDKWEYVIDTNINVPFFLAHGLRDNIASEVGRIIFIGSVCGVYPHAGSPVYGVSKAAMHQMAKELVKFFCDKKVTVNAIVPGFVDTERQKTKPLELRKSIENKVALHRFGYPEEIASLCWEIINNPYINGANLDINGGYCYF